MKGTIFGIASFNILIVFAIFMFIFKNSMKFFNLVPARDFFLGKVWISLSHIFGLLPLLSGTLVVTLVALLISVPLSILTAVYIAEYAGEKHRETLKILIETMSALPSVVLGYIGLYVIAGPIKNIFNLNTGLTAFTGGILLALMAMPTMISISEDSLRALDKSYKEASLALGANRLETIVKILLPAAFPGIFAGIMLGFGRIVGETMTVLMVTGNSPNLTANFLAPVRTMTATIAAEMGEVVHGSDHYYSLFAIGLILFIISFITNTLGDYFIQKSRKGGR
jgi:phosphate transport system permease protein